MSFSTLRTYFIFLSRHKVYTFVSVAGFAVSLAFVIVLSVYSKIQVSMDSFHEKGDRLFLLGDEEGFGNANAVAEYVKNLLPEVETYARVISRKENIGLTGEDWYSGSVMYADRDFFNMFSFPLVEGDTNEVLAVAKSAVLTRTAALKLFSDANPIGRSVVIGRNEVTVTGIMEDFPYNTHFESADVVVPYELTTTFYGRDILDGWENSNFNTYFLGKENSDLPSKEGLLLEKFREDYWMYEEGFSNVVQFVPICDVYFSGLDSYYLRTKSGSLEMTRIYFGVALLILIIALLNYVNMTVAQTGFRGREAAVKRLFGSSKPRLVLQFLSESLLMTSVALAVAILFVFAGQTYFGKLLAAPLYLAENLGNWNSISIIAVALLAISLLAGIIPAIVFSSFNPLEVVKGTASRRIKSGYSKVLIVFQFTVCTILVVSTLIMGSQAGYMRNKDLGFNSENILVLGNNTGLKKEALGSVRDRLLSVPGVEAVGYASGTPYDGGNNNSFEIDGRPVSLQILVGDSCYVDILGLRFTQMFPVSAAEGSTLVYMNNAAINAVRPDTTTWQFDDWRDNAYIGGVFEDLHISSLRNSIGPTMFYFQPEESRPWDIIVKISSSDVYGTASKVRDVYGEINPGKHFEWFFADERIHSWFENERRTTAVMGTFTLLSIVIMVMGVFAMSLYMIRQKEKEIGLRKVNGATVGEILGMLNLQSLGWVAIAFVLACPMAYYGMSKWLQDFAYHIEIGIWPFIVAGFAVTALCLLSVSWQTLRAARANPVESLKSE